MRTLTKTVILLLIAAQPAWALKKADTRISSETFNQMINSSQNETSTIESDMQSIFTTEKKQNPQATDVVDFIEYEVKSGKKGKVVNNAQPEAELKN